MASQDGGSEKRRGSRRPQALKGGSKPNSRNNSTSRNNSPYVSPTKFDTLRDLQAENNAEEIWSCEICKFVFSDPQAKLLECQRCRDRFCTKCLDKPDDEYDILSKCDVMWFCVPCREKVQKNIITDMKIEERCKEIMKHFEARVSVIESEMATKCDEGQVRVLVRDELKKVNPNMKVNEDLAASYTGNETEGTVVTSVMSEINERKQRENNLVIYGVAECDSENREERMKYDKGMVKNIGATCEVDIGDEDIGKVVRLGKFNREKPNRPLLVSFKATSTKRNIFKGARNLKEEESEFAGIRIANDLTKAERENEKQLYAKAKEMQKEDSGDYIYKVRGPPWARRVAKIRPEAK